MLVTRSAALVFWVLFLTTVSTVAGFMVSPGGYLAPLASPSVLGATGGINGSITIGPIYPVCRSPASIAPAPSFYNQIQVLVTPQSGLALTVPVNWVIIGGCWASGTFKIGLHPGVYTLTLTECLISISVDLQGCPSTPKTAVVEWNAWTQVDISLGTGIY